MGVLSGIRLTNHEQSRKLEGELVDGFDLNANKQHSPAIRVVSKRRITNVRTSG
jgi:hypothetical protein